MNVTEIAPDVYRISVLVPEINLQFNHFLVDDDEPLLFHTGMNSIFPAVYEGVSKVIDPARLRWISFSHFEADECGSLNRWLEAAGRAEPLCSEIGAMISINTGFALYTHRTCRTAGKQVCFLKKRKRRSFARTCFIKTAMSRLSLSPT
jgi:flavorubredoxin